MLLTDKFVIFCSFLVRKNVRFTPCGCGNSTLPRGQPLRSIPLAITFMVIMLMLINIIATSMISRSPGMIPGYIKLHLPLWPHRHLIPRPTLGSIAHMPSSTISYQSSTTSTSAPAHNTPCSQRSAYGSVVDSINTVPGKCTKPFRLPRRTDGNLTVTGDYSDHFQVPSVESICCSTMARALPFLERDISRSAGKLPGSIGEE